MRLVLGARNQRFQEKDLSSSLEQVDKIFILCKYFHNLEIFTKNDGTSAIIEKYALYYTIFCSKAGFQKIRHNTKIMKIPEHRFA